MENTYVLNIFNFFF